MGRNQVQEERRPTPRYQGKWWCTHMERQARRRELSGLTSGWCEGEDRELQMHSRDSGYWESATMLLIPGFSAYFPFSAIQASSWLL